MQMILINVQQDKQCVRSSWFGLWVGEIIFLVFWSKLKTRKIYIKVKTFHSNNDFHQNLNNGNHIYRVSDNVYVMI